MKGVLNAVVKILANSLIISATAAVVALISPQDTFLRNVFGFIGFYGLIATMYIFLASVILFLIRFSRIR